MNDHSADTELLIRYLDNELEPEEVDQVKARIAADPVLQDELQNLQLAQQAVRGYGLKSQVTSIHKEMMAEFAGKKDQPFIRRVSRSAAFRVAASVIFLIGLFSLYEFYSTTPVKLYNDYGQVYAMRESRGAQSNNVLASLYNQNKMTELVEKFKTLQQPSVTDHFYAGNAYLQLRNATLAISAFKSAQEKNSVMNTHLMEDDIEYYLAMSYLLHNEAAKALPILQKIRSDKNHLYNDKVGNWFYWKVKRIS